LTARPLVRRQPGQGSSTYEQTEALLNELLAVAVRGSVEHVLHLLGQLITLRREPLYLLLDGKIRRVLRLDAGRRGYDERVAINAASLVLIVLVPIFFTLFDDVSWFIALLLVKITSDFPAG
jgi:hypothetical protein